MLKEPKGKVLLTQYHKINASAYQDVWDFQAVLHEKLKNDKKRQKSLVKNGGYHPINHLIFCEHSPVYTLGKSADQNNLLLDQQSLTKKGFEVFKINRGGDITYHGPGQLTGYLILDLELLYRDVHKYVRNIEEAIILLLEEYGLKGQRLSDFTGVWVEQEGKFKKVCAIGIHLSRWVSMHGFALNIDTELGHFENIVPCGISDKDKAVTSMNELLGRALDFRELEFKLRTILTKVFTLEIIND